VKKPSAPYSITILGHSYKADISRAFYSNGRRALTFIDADDASPIARITVNLPDNELAEGEIALNHDIVQDLIRELPAHGIAHPPHRQVHPHGSYIPFHISFLCEDFSNA
jgi:hypothetical protein